MNSHRLTVVGLLTAALVATGMQSAHAGSAYSVTLNLSATAADINTSVTLTGKVSPRAKGKKVSIYRKNGTTGSWKKISTTKLTSKGRFTKKIKLTAGGPTFFRVAKSAAKGHAKGISPARNISVFRWRSLNDLPFAANPSNVYRGKVSVNGHRFSAKSFSLRTSESVDWDLTGKQCKTLRGYIGIDDDSAAGTTGYAFILDQGLYAYVYEQGLAKGQSARWVHATLTGPKLRFTPSVSPAGNWAAYADMQVYCNS